jgi:hypothetical protein
MINVFVIKKWSALLLMSFAPTIAFTIFSSIYGVMIGTGTFLLVTIIMLLLSNKLLDNPFRQMIEGKGLLVFKMDSTGVIMPFIANVYQPYIKGKVKGQTVSDTYNRNAVYSLSTTGTAKAVMDDKNKTIKFELSEEEFNTSRFGMYHYPVLIWNDQAKTLITKDFFNKKEMSLFSEHTIIFLNRKVEELTNHTRDFGRYVVESLKPSGNVFGGWLTWIIIIGVIVILLVMFGPQLLGAIQGAGGSVSQAVGTASQGTQLVTPIN